MYNHKNKFVISKMVNLLLRVGCCEKSSHPFPIFLFNARGGR